MKDLSYRIPQQRDIRTDGTIDSRLQTALPRALSPLLPGLVTDADGGILLDTDHNAYIDFASGIAVTNVGASNPAVTAAITAAAERFTHTCFMVSPYESYIKVAESLNALTPGDHEKKTILLNSGAEAVENAVKIARCHTGRPAVVVFDNGYHGRTNLTMSMTAKNKPYKSGFGPLASDVYRAPMSYPLKDGLDGPTAATRAITMIEQQVGAENLACVVIEPIQGEGGFIAPAPGFLTALSQWCSEHDVVFVADEVQSGFCRTGNWFACDYEGVIPDLMTMAKGIAAGMPLSAVTGRAEIMDAPGPGGLGGTYGGNPIACAAALAAMEQMESLNLNARAQKIETIITEILGPLTELPTVAELRGRGAMMALEFTAATPTLTAAIAAECRQQKVLILTCGMSGNVIRLLPPLVIPESVLRDGLNVLAQTIKELS